MYVQHTRSHETDTLLLDGQNSETSNETTIAYVKQVLSTVRTLSILSQKKNSYESLGHYFIYHKDDINV